jgi:hypothetical protein
MIILRFGLLSTSGMRDGPAKPGLRAFQPVKTAVVRVGVLSVIICEFPISRKGKHFQNYSCKKRYQVLKSKKQELKLSPVK